MKKRSRALALLAAVTVTVTSLPGMAYAQTSDVSKEDTNGVTDEVKNAYSDEGYKLVWNDEFNGDSLNRDDWNVETHEAGWVNSELQEYVDSDKNIYIKDGQLVIQPIDNGDGTYTSGRVSTQHKQDFTYGIFEVEATVPEGQGYLPAFWLMATDESVYGQWPRCGEIDCMEVMGQDTTKAYGTIHYGNPHKESQNTYTVSEENSFSKKKHKFTCEWEPGKITWYIDGVKYHEESDWYSTTEGVGTLTYPAPFDQPFYVILNLAVGGSWVGNPDANTTFEDQQYTIDYVRVYQKDSYDENVTRPEQPVQTAREADENGNYLHNGDFSVAETIKGEDGTKDNDWVFLTANSGVGDATIDTDNKEIVITTENAGTVDYSIQLVQPKLPFEKTAEYQVSFDAYASEARTMNVDIKAPENGWITYADTFKPELTTEKQTFTYNFTMNNTTDLAGRLEFNMGNMGSTADIHISNVSVKKIKDADPSIANAKSVLADGNYIYNGSFQEGDKHLGSWDITNECDADISVTNYADSRRLKVVSEKAENLSDVTISQSDLAISEGNDYVFSFSAQAAEATKIKAIVAGIEQEFDITTDKQTYSLSLAGTEELKNKNVELQLAANTTVLIDNVRLVEDTMIKNGSFNAGLTSFTSWQDDATASASVSVDSLSEDNALQVVVNKTGTEDWKIQVMQKGIKLEKGQDYLLTFKAKSTLDRQIRVIMQGEENRGYADYTGNNIVDLTSEYKTYKKVFTMNEETDPAAFLSICLGKVDREINETHTVTIDDITLEPVTLNMLKNADFSNEEDAMTGWSETIANWGGDYVTEATRSIEDGAITYDIANPGTAEWHVQLKQSGLSLKAGETYKVAYDVTSTVARQIKSGVMSTSYTWYGGSDPELEANKKTHIVFEFTMPTDDSAADFYVTMGKLDGVDTPASVITLSNFKLANAKYFIDDEETEDPGEDPGDKPVDDPVPYNTNILSNADFANALTGWTETIANWGADYETVASSSIADGAITYSIQNPGTDDWHVQLKQTPVALEKDAKYKATFDVVSTADRTIKTGVLDASYNTYGEADIVLKANEETEASFTFDMTKADNNAAFFISMGKIKNAVTPASDITIKNIKLVKVDPNESEVIPEVTPTATPVPTTTPEPTAVPTTTPVPTAAPTAAPTATPTAAPTPTAVPTATPVVEEPTPAPTTVATPEETTTVKKAEIKKVTSSKKKQITVKWAKHNSAAGYQIQISTSKKFAKKSTQTITVKSSKQTSKTVKNLKSNKKYYVRVREFAKNSNKKVYGKWSAKTSIKTK